MRSTMALGCSLTRLVFTVKRFVAFLKLWFMKMPSAFARRKTYQGPVASADESLSLPTVEVASFIQRL